jgi:L-lactate dehydrogenase complex protein LldG
MSQSPSKNNILKKIRMALETPTPLPFPKSEGNEFLFQPPQQDLVVEFAEQFSSLQGKFVFCIDIVELNQQIQKLFYQNQWTKLYCTEEKWKVLIPPPLVHEELDSCDAAITSCEYLVARTGSMILGSVHQGRLPSVYAPVHICIAYTSQLVYDIRDGLDALKNKYRDFLPSMISFATGPSRTADIEKTLVVGVHGPKEVYCFVVDDSNN